MGKQSAETLAKVIAHPIASGSVAGLDWSEGEPKELGGFAFLEGEDGLWVIAPDKEIPNWVKMTPADGQQLVRMLEELVDEIAKMAAR